MIPTQNIVAWGAVVPWADPRQVEQDLIISRAIVAIFEDPFLRTALRFRGGTALNKLHFPAPLRYSEDIDISCAQRRVRSGRCSTRCVRPCNRGSVRRSTTPVPSRRSCAFALKQRTAAGCRSASRWKPISARSTRSIHPWTCLLPSIIHGRRAHIAGMYAGERRRLSSRNRNTGFGSPTAAANRSPAAPRGCPDGP